jgi:hypothetical protein
MRISPEGAAHSVRSYHQGVAGGTDTPQKTLAGCHVGSRSNQRDIECHFAPLIPPQEINECPDFLLSLSRIQTVKGWYGMAFPSQPSAKLPKVNASMQ